MTNIEVRQLLHQQDPYLMVSEVTYIDKHRIESIKNHSGNEGHIHGHFPGASIVPGAMIQEMCTQSAGVLITKFYSPVLNYNSKITKGHALGVLNKVDYAKFISILRPNKAAIINVELLSRIGSAFKFRGRVSQGDKLCAKFLFTLVNIDDSNLYE